jgi:hypothetical protein
MSRKTLTPLQVIKISETLEDFKALLPRYRKCKEDETGDLLHKFCSRNRNPIFDLTSIEYFSSNLMSENAKGEDKKKLVLDHYIQRTKAVKLIFQELDIRENLTFDDFVSLLKRYCSTVLLTKEEHTKVTVFAKKRPSCFNYEIYPDCGVLVNGLSEHILN